MNFTMIGLLLREALDRLCVRLNMYLVHSHSDGESHSNFECTPLIDERALSGLTLTVQYVWAVWGKKSMPAERPTSASRRPKVLQPHLTESSSAYQHVPASTAPYHPPSTPTNSNSVITRAQAPWNMHNYIHLYIGLPLVNGPPVETQ